MAAAASPDYVFHKTANILTQYTLGEQLGQPVEIAGIPLRIAGVVPASGLLLKRDPGVPLVYAGFGIALLGGALSLVATRQLWAVGEQEQRLLHVGGLCNRNLTAFAQELPQLLEALSAKAAA